MLLRSPQHSQGSKKTTKRRGVQEILYHQDAVKSQGESPWRLN